MLVQYSVPLVMSRHEYSDGFFLIMPEIFRSFSEILSNFSWFDVVKCAYDMIEVKEG